MASMNGEERPAEGDEEEDWTAEVNMDEFYTDAAKYWEVRTTWCLD